MSELKRLLFMYTETPVHAGAPSGLGVIDLPIQREEITQLPMIAGSGVRGALREQLVIPREHGLELFGPEPPKKTADEAARKEAWQGAIHFADAQLLLFSVRSGKGGWAYVTSPLLLARLWRHACIAGLPPDPAVRTLAEAEVTGALVPTGSALELASAVVLEDFELRVQSSDRTVMNNFAKWLTSNVLPKVDGFEPFIGRLTRQLVVVADDVLQILVQRGTEVHTRVAIDADTGTVADGALWNEEALPAECVLWSTVFVDKSRKRGSETSADVLSKSFDDAVRDAGRVWLGGDRGVGRGAVALRLATPAAVKAQGGAGRAA